MLADIWRVLATPTTGRTWYEWATIAMAHAVLGADLGALADLLVILAALGARGDIAEMDLNPVRAGPAGATVLDAVILRAPTEIEGKARQ